MGWYMAALRWNYVLVVALTATLAAQLCKVAINLILIHRFIPERLWGAGGMPSAHAATVCSMVVATGRHTGLHSTDFAIALVLSVIVMYDAMGVRFETGKQAQVLNRLIGEWMEQGAQVLPILGDKKLKEMIGHTPFQVLTGAAMGVAIAFAIPLV